MICCLSLCSFGLLPWRQSVPEGRGWEEEEEEEGRWWEERDRSLRGRYQRRKMVVPTTRKEKARKTKLPCKGGSREKKVSFVRAAEATSEDSDSTTFFTENDKQKLFYTDASINVSFLAQEGALYQGLFSWLPTWFLLQP